MKKCKVCEAHFESYRPMQSVCSIECAKAMGRVKAEKEEKQKIKLLKEKIKTRQEWLKEAQKAFNAYIRLRDSGLPCISCNQFSKSAYHAGHFVSIGASSYLRFNELNVNNQCPSCNTYKGGNALNYQDGLILKIGKQAVEELRNAPRLKDWKIDEIKEIKQIYSTKLKELKKVML